MKTSSGLCAALLVGALACGCDGPKHNQPPPQAARNWAAAMNIDVAGVTCAETDSDGDGYVSCDIGIRGDQARIISIQCAAEVTWANTGGCKSTQAKSARPSQ